MARWTLLPFRFGFETPPTGLDVEWQAAASQGDKREIPACPSHLPLPFGFPHHSATAGPPLKSTEVRESERVKTLPTQRERLDRLSYLVLPFRKAAVSSFLLSILTIPLVPPSLKIASGFRYASLPEEGSRLC